MRILVLTCLWRRHRLSEFVLDRYVAIRGALRGQVDVDLLAVGSEGTTTRRMVEARGFRYLEHTNRPVGAKWNAGARAAREFQPEAVLIVGSDDIVTTNLLPRYAHRVAAGADLVAVRDNYFWDLHAGALLHREGYEGARRDEPIGAARLLTSVLLDRLDWTPWSPTLDRGLDLSMWDRIGALNPAPRLDVLSMQDEDVAVVDIKSEVNICAFDSVRRAPRTRAVDESVLACFPAEEIKRLRELGRSMRGEAESAEQLSSQPPAVPNRLLRSGSWEVRRPGEARGLRSLFAPRARQGRGPS